MSEHEPSTGESSSEGSQDVCSSDGEVDFVFNGDFVPYQDEDGIFPFVLEQCFKGQVP